MSIPIAASYSQNAPAGFTSTTIASDWSQPVGVCFASDGRMVVWEKAGKVWMLDKNTSGTYVKPASPLLDLSDEVGDWRDHGLLGLTLDPQFTTNGRIYLLYVVDRYYLNYHDANNQPLPGYSATAANLDKWGTSYQSTFGVPFGGSIGRLTRYTARTSDGFHSIDPASRQVLLGETISTGIAVLYETHGVGSLAFGSDGSLLLSTGDGASTSVDTGNFPNSYAVQALKDGVITAKENVGSFRAQLIDTHSGKILRLDPATGNGLPSNPYFDASQPRAPRSRVFALGFRNPFRFTIKPGTGSNNPAIADPGVLYVGDVGLNTWEELDVVTGKGQNFGWPIYEGLQLNTAFGSLSKANPDAPNSLYNGGSCNQPLFAFIDLLKQDTRNTVSFPNPCNASQQVPNQVPHWKHTRPVLDWKHSTGPSRTAGFDDLGNARPDTMGTGTSPIAGSSFAGSASMAGVWYTANNFPVQYQNTYFHGDYVSNWVRAINFNTSNQPTKVAQFIPNGAVPVSMAVNTLLSDGALYYVNYSSQEVRRVAYTGNKPPLALVSANQRYGPSPLAVQFSSSGSLDPEGGVVNYLWDFGDGATSTLANPSHSFSGNGPKKFTVTFTVKDVLGAASTAQLIISVNNTPPVVHITSPLNNSLYSVNRSTDSTYQLRANVSDAEQSGSGLTYQWQTVLHHNTHVHEEPIDNSVSTSTEISPIGCDGQQYHFSVSLTVTDAAGLSSIDIVNLYPNCDQYLNVVNLQGSAGNGQVTLSWSPPPGLYDEVLIVAATASISGLPSGDGSGYLANANFTGAGTALLGGKAVYKGRFSNQTVMGLSGGTPYYFRAFTRVGSFWSQGTQINVLPASTGITKVTPVLTWLNPANITQGTALSSTQLNATANVAGSFVYLPAAGTVLLEGSNQSLLVNFTPTNTATYTTAEKTVSINVVSPTSLCTASGTILREVWTNVPGSTIASIPLNSQPTLTDQLTSFRTPAGYGDNYGQRIRGYICAPSTGSYQFFMQGDDKAELYLSSDGNPDNKVKIASVTTSWSWTQRPEQQSSLITLQQGQRYYVEVLHKEGTGADVLRIGWLTPGMAAGAEPLVIPGTVLSPFVPVTTKVTPVITWHNPANITQGTALSSTQLNATANVAGSFVYSPAAGTVLSAGNNQGLSVTFTPTNTSTYNKANKTVSINVLSSTSLCTASGTILREVWTNVPGNTIASIPLNTAPSLTDQLTSFRTLAGYGDNYGQRIRGYICAPQGGSYQFFMQGDDKAELYLSSDGNPDNKQKIASVTTSWSWTQRPEQQSSLITLQQGQRYYVEVLHKEGTGADVLRVGWHTPQMTATEEPVIIPGTVLSPFVPSARLSEGAEPMPSMTALLSAQPNPFSNRVNIFFTPVGTGRSVLSLYDTHGVIINQLFDGVTKEGETTQLEMDGRSLSDGVYIIRMISEGEVKHLRLILVK